MEVQMEMQQQWQRRASYQVIRSALSEAELEQISPKSQKKEPSLCRRGRDKLRCSGTTVKFLLLKCIPILRWLPRYPVRESFLGDLISGLSVAIIQLPQGLAYALLAAVPPVFGLYTSFYPVLLYSVFGTSRHISAGTFAVLSVMIGSVTESLAPNENFMLPGNGTSLDVEARDKARVQLAVALSFLSGLFQVVLGLMQFGFVATYLAEPLVRGYSTAASIHVTVSQLKNMFGLEFNQQSQPLSLIYSIIVFFSKLPETNVGALITGVIALSALFAVKFVNQKFSSKLPIPIPIELLTIVVATGISHGLKLKEMFGIDIVGNIPSGLRAPSLPDISLFGKMVGNSFAIAVVGYSITIAMGKMFAMKHGYQVDSNQELIALGLSNFVGSFFHCFPIGTAMSRSLVQENTGGSSQVAGIVSSLVILVIILKAGQLFEDLPKAILASVVIVNLHGMYKQFGDISVFWKTNKIDLLIWLVTFVATLLLNLDIGLAVSVAFALLTVIFRTQLPHYSILGQVSKTDIYRDLEEFNEVKEVSGIKIFRSSSTIYFANAELYAETLKTKSGIDVDKLIQKKKKAMKKQRKTKKEDKIADREDNVTKDKVTGRINNGFLDVEVTGSKEMTAMNNSRLAVAADEEVLETQVSTTQKTSNEPTLESLGLRKPCFHSLILDFAAVSFVDTVCIKVLKNIFRDFHEIEVNVYLVGCHTHVINQLETGNFFSKTITKAQLFASVHDAVVYLEKKHDQKTKDEVLTLHVQNQKDGMTRAEESLRSRTVTKICRRSENHKNTRNATLGQNKDPP
ncbi:solute carrier family 26 member 6-like isoform X1 [Rhinatrema bivittatum]|uniref:solute carrier family 26 member 6-like isoform X1 n=1 Tax=Rhinatrema bivittatum TaxID=194408 RepID=UPI00112D9F4D|nr:solute carrier family 26 member 6-like isoform X1 [Rhinatrema bivittatum]